MGNLSSLYDEVSKKDKENVCEQTPTKNNIRSMDVAFDPRSPTSSISRTPIQVEVTPQRSRKQLKTNSDTSIGDDSSEGDSEAKPRSPLKMIDPDSPKNFLRYKQVKGLHKELRRHGYDPSRLYDGTQH